MSRLRRGCTLAVAGALLSAPAAAGGLSVARYTGEHGHPTTDNGTAIYFNPGALGRTEGSRLLLDGNFAYRKMTYERTAAPSDAAAPAGYEDANVGTAKLANVAAVPNLFFTTKLDRLGLGLGVHAPFGGVAEFRKNQQFKDDPVFAGPEDGVQRWWLVSGVASSVYFTGAASYDLADMLSVGLAVNLIRSRLAITRSLVLGQGSVANASDVTAEGRARFNADGWEWSVGAGVLLQPTETLWIGLSYQSQPNFVGGSKTDGGFTAVFPGAAGINQEVRERAELHQTLPDIFRLGFAYRPQSQLELRLFGNYERWSVMQDQCLSQEGTGCKIAPDGSTVRGSVLINARRDWDDTVGVRAGVSYFTTPEETVEVFGGVGFDGNAVPDATLAPDIPDANKIHVAAGARVGLGSRVHLAASYTHLHFLERDNRGKSQLNDLEPLSVSPDAGGVYKSWVGILNANLEVSF